MSIATAQEFDTAEVLAPEQPLTLEDSGLARDTLNSLIVKSLHGGEASPAPRAAVGRFDQPVVRLGRLRRRAVPALTVGHGLSRVQ